MSLLKETRKSWGYVISNEIVYWSELCNPDLEPTTHVAGWFAEYNLGLLCVELNFKLV